MVAPPGDAGEQWTGMTEADKCPGNTHCFSPAATTAASANVPRNGRRKGLGNASRTAAPALPSPPCVRVLQ